MKVWVKRESPFSAGKYCALASKQVAMYPVLQQTFR